MKNNIKTKRILSIDLIKIIAMYAAIMVHTEYRLFDTNWGSLATFMYQSGVIAILLFFMASGYLLLGRRNINYKYVLNKIIKIIRYILIFCVGYWICKSLEDQHNFNFNYLLQIIIDSCRGKGSLFVFWYFTATIIIFIFLPILNYIYIYYYRIFILFFILLLLIQNFVFCLGLVNNGSEFIPAIYKQYIWMGYFCMGGIIKKINFQIPYSWLLTLIIILVNFLFEQIFNHYIENNRASFYYTSPIVLVYAFLVFISCLKLKLENYRKYMGQLSNLYLLVFTIHSFMIGYIINVFINIPFSPIIVWIVLSIITTIISWIVMRIPYINKLLTL